MISKARYVHTNLVARDWRRLVDFYMNVFGCQPVPPERHLEADWVARATGIPSAQIHGMHLRLPGYNENGPTLEIFQYNHLTEGSVPKINRPGFAHLAFSVADVKAALAEVTAAGGISVGEIVEVEIPDAGQIRFVYAADPEGNLLELQTWEALKEPAEEES